jgi:hypothetical protein
VAKSLGASSRVLVGMLVGALLAAGVTYLILRDSIVRPTLRSASTASASSDAEWWQALGDHLSLDAFYWSQLEREPSDDIAASILDEGVVFTARLVQVSPEPSSVTFDVLTVTSVGEDQLDSNVYEHTQTVPLGSDHVPVVLHEQLIGSAMGTEADYSGPITVAFDQFVGLVDRDPTLLEDHVFTVVCDRRGLQGLLWEYRE